MWSLEVFLNRIRPTVDGPVTWAIRLKDGGDHAFETDGTLWRWLAGHSQGDIVVTTTARRWATLLFNLQAGHDTAADHLTITGIPDRVREFKALARIR
jgi:hypothetical protein